MLASGCRCSFWSCLRNERSRDVDLLGMVKPRRVGCGRGRAAVVEQVRVCASPVQGELSKRPPLKPASSIHDPDRRREDRLPGPRNCAMRRRRSGLAHISLFLPHGKRSWSNKKVIVPRLLMKNDCVQCRVIFQLLGRLSVGPGSMTAS